MRFVILGYGRVGRRVVELVANEGHEFTVVENDPDRAERARTDGHDVVEGDGADESVLADAGIASADAIAALSGDLNTNFTACMIAAEHGCRTVLRIDEDYREEIYEKYAEDVDEIVYPERLGAAGAKTALLGGDFNVVADVTESLSVASVVVPDDSPLVGKRVVEIELPGDARIYAHGTERDPLTIPLPRTSVGAGDRVAVLASPGDLEDVRAVIRGDRAT